MQSCRSARHPAGAAPIVLLAITALVALMVLILPQALRRGETGAPAEPPAKTASTPRLDPEPYRTQIIALEQILYQRSPASYADVGRIVQQTRQLADALRGDGRDVRRMRAFAELYAFAGAVDVVEDVGYQAPNLTHMREQWEPVRDAIFSPAAWFRSSTAGLAATQAQRPPAVDRTLVRQLEQLCTDLEQLAADGRREALAFGEGQVDAGRETAAARDQERRWRSWCQDWEGRLQDLAARFPARPSADADIHTTMAYQELGKSLRELRLLPIHSGSTANIPFLYERERHLDTAEWHASQARHHLANLPS